LKPLIYLELRQLANSIRNVARSPKRLIPALIIGAWLIAVIINNLLMLFGVSSPTLSSHVMLSRFPYENIWTAIFLFMTVMAGSIIYSSLREGLLIFTPAHIDFLFPTPISRRSVLVVKLLRDYVKYAVIIAFVLTVVGSPFYSEFRISPYPAIIFSWFGTFFLVVALINVTHTLTIVTTFGIQRFRFAPALIKLVVLGIALILIGTAAVHFARTGDALASLAASARTEAAKVLLAPVAWCTDLILAPVAGGVIYENREQLIWLFLLALGSLVVLLARPENIYEPSLGISVRMARIKAAIRAGDLTTVRIQTHGVKVRKYAAPPVRPFGRCASAMLWKNLVVCLRAPGRMLVLLLVAPPLAAVAIGAFVHQTALLTMSPLMIPYAAWMLALVAEQELRSELRQANIIKAMPVSAFRLIAVQVLYQWLMIAAVVSVAGLSVYLAIPQADPAVVGLSVIGSLALGFSIVAALSIPVLLYPNARDWTQAFITQLFSLFLTSIVFLPSLGLGAALVLSHVSLTVVGAAVAALNLALGLAALAIAGALFRKFDPTSD